MNRRNWIYGGIVVLAVVVIGAVVLLMGSSQPSETNGQQGKTSTSSLPNSGPAPSANAVPSASQHIAPGMTNAAPSDNASIKKLLQEMLKQKGIKEMPPVEKYLHDEIASGDKARMLRAFDDAVYHQYWDKSDVVAALKTFLNDPTPYVRYLAGRDFLIMGDNEGYSALLGLVQSNASLDGLSQDVRIDAANTLAQFRQTDAINAVAALYAKTPNAELSQDLANLGAQVPGENQMPFVASDLAITEYAKAGATQFLPQITSTFYNTQNADVKAAAAWALATMSNNQDAISYLIQQAQVGLNDPSQAGSLSVRNAIKYLGNIQTPQAKQTLEAALSSTDSVVVQTAAANLVLNQGGSDKVNQLVASELNGTPNPLGAGMALNLAPQLLSDPQVQAAGQTFSEHDGSGAWQRATVVQGSWPVYNWIDGYVVKLNK
jgi:HEAT repeat protein